MTGTCGEPKHNERDKTTAADDVLKYLVYVADRVENVTASLENRLAKVANEEVPRQKAPTDGDVVKALPPLLQEYRCAGWRIEGHIDRLFSLLDRLEV